VPVLLFLPLWGFLYWGTLDPAPVEATGAVAAGETVYPADCASCHGSGGGGGFGPALDTVNQTFPDYKEQVWWIINGSNGVGKGAPYGSPDRPGGQRIAATGGMPAWGATLSAEELLGVVYHERLAFGGATEDELAELLAIAENPDLPANFEEGTTPEEVAAQLTSLIPADFVPPAG
jgi:mono/diheme cytochrome c family protein